MLKEYIGRSGSEMDFLFKILKSQHKDLLISTQLVPKLKQACEMYLDERGESIISDDLWSSQFTEEDWVGAGMGGIVPDNDIHLGK